MISSSQRNAFAEENEQTNLLMKLKEKKKQMIDRQSEIQKRIKEYFSDLTIQIYHKQTATLDSFKNKLYQFFQAIDNFSSMTEDERNGETEQISKILDFELEVVENKKFKQLLQTNIVDLCCDQHFEINATIMSSEQQKTNKKTFGNANMFLKASYAEQIDKLQEKIQKLMLKEQKLKSRLGQMDSRHKMKKLGNTYLPYEQKSISSLLLQRLESQNKILIEQISDCSQKMISLRSQNSILMKQRQTSHFLQTEKKKGQPINAIQQSIQFSQYQQKVVLLQSQVEHLRSELQNQRNLIIQRQQQILRCKNQSEQQLRQKIQQLSDYNERLYRQCESNISKKVDLQQKLQQQMTEHHSQTKQIQSIKQMNNNYTKLLKMKQDKIIQLDIELTKHLIQFKQSEDNYRKLYVESAQTIENKDNILKAKLLQIQSLKSIIKKQQSEKNQIRQKLTQKQQEIFNQSEKVKNIQLQLAKANKDKESHAKKQIKKIKNQLKKTFQDQKNELIQDFKLKYGGFMEKIQILKKQTFDNRDKLQKKLKIEQNRMSMFKDRVAYQTKEMIQKLGKPGQKQKIIEIIQSYIENESTLTLKNTQIKMLKDQINALKKQPAKKETIKNNCSQVQICLQLKQFEKKLFMEKMQMQQSLHESRMKQQQQEYQLIIQQKVQALENLVTKCQIYEKNAKDLKTQLKTVNESANPEIMELKKSNQQMAEKQKRTQSLVNSLKNNLTKVQNQAQQAKQQLKLKKDIIIGLKKQLKDKDLQKQKLNQTINMLMDDAQKLKKSSKEANKKEAIFEEFKDKLINQTELSQQIIQLKFNLQQKQKYHKIQMNKKDQIIKQMKENQQILNKKLKSQSILDDEILDLKQKNRKLKGQIDRKDTLIQHIKQKQQKVTNETIVAAEALQIQNKKMKKQLETEKSKFQGLKFKQRKMETNYQLLKITLIKIYEKFCQKMNTTTYTSLQKDYNTFKSDDKKTRYQFTVQKTPQVMDISRYKQGLSILQISGEDLEIVNTKSIDPYSPIPNKMIQCTVTQNINLDVSKLTQLLQSQQIDTNPILSLFNFVLDERTITQI